MVKVTLRNPLDKNDLLPYYIVPNDTVLAQDWLRALKSLLQSRNMLEKNFCFLGFPNTARSLQYLCDQLNYHVSVINSSIGDRYYITETYSPELLVWNDNGPNHVVFNELHNHFERLQGTVWQLSDYYKQADFKTKYAIRQLNNICHELESLILSQRKLKQDSYWLRPSQITTWLAAPRYDLTDEHRKGFATNGYNREFGAVYMHWAQIGKTYFEVWRDEGAPALTDTVCEAITALKYYTGEFDIEWGRSITLEGQDWWRKYLTNYYDWLVQNKVDLNDPSNSLGYLKIGHVDLIKSFGTDNVESIWDMLSTHLDIASVEVDDVRADYPEVWSDSDYQDRQIERLKEGYKYGDNNVVD